MAESEQAFFEADGRKIPLGKDFSVGPMTFGELTRIIQDYSKDFYASQSQQLQEFLTDLKAGRPSALLILFITCGLGLWIAYLVIYQFLEEEPPQSSKEKVKEEPIVLRDFTEDQLREYNGTNSKPIYIGLDGNVYDVSKADEYYGVGAAYHCFAGRNATRAMAKFSFEENELNNTDVSDLSPFEKSTLEDWVQKFKYFKCYPVVGKYSTPPSGLELSKEQLKDYKGEGEVSVSANRIDSPIYIALNGKIYDVSFGGKEMYGKEGPYFRFAGLDVSRALAKMSFEPEDINNSSTDDLNEKEKKTLSEWEEKFSKTKKYPIVGKLV